MKKIIIFRGYVVTIMFFTQCTILPPSDTPTPPPEYYGEIEYLDENTLEAVIVRSFDNMRFDYGTKPLEWGNLTFKWVELIPYTAAVGDYVVKYDELSYTQQHTGAGAWNWQPDNLLYKFEGTRRYYFATTINNIATETPKGIRLFRVSYKGNNDTGYGNDVVNIASTYLEVPYVLGYVNNEYGEEIVKGLNQGYEGIDCSGLVSWAYQRNGYDVNPGQTGNENKINNTNAQMLMERFGVRYNQFGDWQNYHVQTGDIWICGELVPPDYHWKADHVAITYMTSQDWHDAIFFHATKSNQKVVKEYLTSYLENNCLDWGTPAVAGYGTVIVNSH